MVGDGRTDGRQTTVGRQLDGYTISSPCEPNGSGELKSGDIDFLYTQGQLTLYSVVGSCQNWNSSKLLCMSSLPARMKRIQSKLKAQEWSQQFSYYKSMGIFPDAQGQLTPQSRVQSGQISNSSEIFWFSLLPARMKKFQKYSKKGAKLTYPRR